MSPEAASAGLDGTLAALADPTRRAIVDLLRQEPRCSGDLAAALSTSAPAMSRHLKVLRRAGLVEVAPGDDDARMRTYRLRPEPFTSLRSWVDEVSALWSEQLGAFRAYAERAAKKGRR